MNLWSAISLGFKEIWAHKFRSLLTMLGIILGVSSLVAMTALVKGMEVGMKEALVAVGGLQKVRVEQSSVPVEQRHLRDQAVGVTIHDVFALQESAPLVTRISPEMRLMGATVSAKGKSFRPFMCTGVWPIALEMSEHVIEHGRMFNEYDADQASSVCVIGTATRDELFGAPDQIGEEIIPIGESILINGQPFTIIGMFKHYESDQDRKRRELAQLQAKEPQRSGPTRNRGWGGGRRGNFVFWLKNATIYIPLDTMWMKFRTGGYTGGRGSGGSSMGEGGDRRLTTLELKVADIELLTPALQQIRNVLMVTHKGIEDFSFRTQEDWAQNITTFIRNARLSGGLIAIISLLVGGIGIMNIMLASISERIREIGIRKAIGASTADVFVQIIVESVVIAVLGGLAGLACSFALVKTISSMTPTDNTPVVTMTSLLLAFGFSVAVGMLAGIIPAIKAARLDPIQALRYE